MSKRTTQSPKCQVEKLPSLGSLVDAMPLDFHLYVLEALAADAWGYGGVVDVKDSIDNILIAMQEQIGTREFLSERGQLMFDLFLSYAPAFRKELAREQERNRREAERRAARQVGELAATGK